MYLTIQLNIDRIVVEFSGGKNMGKQLRIIDNDWIVSVIAIDEVTGRPVWGSSKAFGSIQKACSYIKNVLKKDTKDEYTSVKNCSTEELLLKEEFLINR